MKSAIKIHKKLSARHNGSKEPVGIYPSDWVANTMYMPVEGGLKPFSFVGREYLLPIYNSSSKRILLQCGRQVEKSTTLGNMTLAYSILNYHFKTLFVSPTETQTGVFSRDKITAPIENSDKLKFYLKRPSSVLLKQFTTNSDITLRYAYLTADRTRGIAGIDMLLLDEVQDILTDVIPIVEETQSHSPYKIRLYSGTPKSLDNTISNYWENQSTQNEWVIPCDACGLKGMRHWNIVSERNIGKHFLICDKCGKEISPIHPEAQWAAMNPTPMMKGRVLLTPFEGYRIPQLITSWASWGEIVDKYTTYPRRQFYNEVLGLGYDSGDRPLTKTALRACCNPNLTMYPPIHGGSGDVWMGVDWGTDENTNTVICLGKYINDRFTAFYWKRLEGEDNIPENQIEIISELIDRFKVTQVGTDYGGGYDRNSKLILRYGIKRIVQYQYTNSSDKVTYNAGLTRFMVNRTAVLADVINAINRGNEFSFPKWEEFETYGNDMSNIIADYNDSRRQIIFDKTPGTTDDSLHALTYCFLASMLKHPRYDIMAPDNTKKVTE